MTQPQSAIQREIRQRRPFQSRSQEGVIALLRTADVVRRVLARVVEPHGITLQQYNVLRILRGAGAEGLPTLEVGERMIEQTPGVTRLLDRLEAKGLVRRKRCPHDRRQVLCFATPAARRLVDQLDAPMDRADRDALRALETGELDALLRALDRVRSGHAPRGHAPQDRSRAHALKPT
ncbi:MAG TPA: MarR family transcriptional regulator [Vicinamibacteria bacterium]